MAGKLTNQHNAVFNNMLTVCQLRGKDATGVIRIKPDNDYEFVKRVGTPEILLDTKSYDKQIMSGPTKALIGHCRAKTVGLNTNKNAHPFDFDKVIGVHNGTLKGHYQHEGWAKIDVDSELLYYHIDKVGIEEALPTFDADGAWALVFWNKEDNTINFIRNKERPLWFTHSKNLDILLWASEPWMLSAAMRSIDEWEPEEGNARRWELPVDTLYSFSLDHAATGKEVLTMKQPKEIKGKEVRAYSGNSHGWHGGRKWVNGKWVDSNEMTTLGGPTGNSKGGQVVHPFQRVGETPADRLDDTLDDLHKTSQNRARLLALRERIRSQDASSTTNTSASAAKSSLLNSSGTPMASTNTGSGPRQILSLPSPSSKASQQDSNVSTLSLPDGNTCSSRSKLSVSKVSHRQVLGQNYITDNKTGREFGEERFEQETNAVCCHCENPIGGLEDVDQIFIHHNKKLDEEVITFLCKQCLIEPFA